MTKRISLIFIESNTNTTMPRLHSFFYRGYRRCERIGIPGASDKRSMVGWRKTSAGRVVVLVEIETCCPTLVRLNFANDGEQEPRGKRFRTFPAGRGSCRGRQKSRSVDGEVGGVMGDHAGGTMGKRKRRAKRRVAFNVERAELSLQRLWLVAVHDELRLAWAGSWRRRAPIIERAISAEKNHAKIMENSRAWSPHIRSRSTGRCLMYLFDVLKNLICFLHHLFSSSFFSRHMPLYRSCYVNHILLRGFTDEPSAIDKQSHVRK